jgi:hypothetical protein
LPKNVFFLVIGILVQNDSRAHNHFPASVSALQGADIERLVGGMQNAIFFQTLNSEDGFPRHFPDRGNARTNRRTIHQDGTRSALAFSTAVLASSQIEVFPQDMQ